MCNHEGYKQKFCEVCLLDLKAEQGIVIERLTQRWEAVYDCHPELHDDMRAIETKYPVTGIKVLESIPFSADLPKYLLQHQVGPLRGELREVMENLLTAYSKHVEKRDDVMIGVNDTGFFLYSTCRRAK